MTDLVDPDVGVGVVLAMNPAPLPMPHEHGEIGHPSPNLVDRPRHLDGAVGGATMQEHRDRDARETCAKQSRKDDETGECEKPHGSCRQSARFAPSRRDPSASRNTKNPQ